MYFVFFYSSFDIESVLICIDILKYLCIVFFSSNCYLFVMFLFKVCFIFLYICLVVDIYNVYIVFMIGYSDFFFKIYKYI